MIIIRERKPVLQTPGDLTVLRGLDPIFNCKSLELPWKYNKPFVSCIPIGTYKVKRRHSKKYGAHFEILDVYKRTVILIHNANFVSQLQGCVAVGKVFKDIDGDGLKDVTSSKFTLKKLNKILPNEFELKIKYAA